MFEYLKDFSKIIVTGPQRSGTTICAKMIANDTNHKYVDEFEIITLSKTDGGEKYNKFLENKIKNLFNSKDDIVLQCPSACAICHKIDAAIIIMRRDINDIVKSQNRIKWEQEKELALYGLKEGIISEIKYYYWDSFQKNIIKNYFEIDYESLKDHYMWVKKKHRVNFTDKQTMLNKTDVF